MKQKLRLMMSMLLCMLFGMGTAWGQEVTYDFTESGWTVSNGTLSNGTVSITGNGSANFKMNTGYFILGKSGAYITLPIYDFDVEKIVVTGRSGASASTKMNVYVGENAVSTETEGCTGTNTYKIASGYQTAGNAYTIKVTSNHNAQFTKIEMTDAFITIPSFFDYQQRQAIADAIKISKLRLIKNKRRKSVEGF